MGPISLDWKEWDAICSKVDVGKFHGLLTFPGKSMGKVEQERKAEFVHFVLSSRVSQCCSASWQVRGCTIYLPWNIWKRCWTPGIRTISGKFLVVQQLRLCASTTGGHGFHPWSGNWDALYIWWYGQKNLKKKDNFTMDFPPIPFPISFSKKKKSINLEMFSA